jgi:hypothetical protein
MTNKSFFTDLPDFDSPNLEDEMEAILISDAQLFKKLELLLETFSWSEKMAIGQVAYWLIDRSHTQLVKLTPQRGEFSVPVKQAIEFVEQLSPQALAELAIEILQEDFEICEVENEQN